MALLFDPFNRDPIHIEHVNFMGTNIEKIIYKGAIVFEETVIPEDLTFAEATLEQIKYLESVGRIREFFHEGDKKQIMWNGQLVTFKIIGLYQDVDENGEDAPITLCTETTLPTPPYYSINANVDTGGGYPNSDLKNISIPEILNGFSKEWQEAMITVRKRSLTNKIDDEWIISRDNVKLFPLAFAEIYSDVGMAKSSNSDVANLNNRFSWGDEGTQYKYFKDIVGDQDPIINNSNLKFITWLRTRNIINVVNEYSSFMIISNGVAGNVMSRPPQTLPLTVCFCI